MRILTFVFLIQFLLSTLRAQNCVDPELIPLDPIEYIINELASERFGGRYPGTRGDSLATWFIVENLKELGLTPMGDSGTYLQKFSIKLQAKVTESTHVKIKKKILKPDERLYPTRFSNNGKASGRVVTPEFKLQDQFPTLLFPNSVRKKIVLINLNQIKELYDQEGADFRHFRLQSLINYLSDNNVRGILFTSANSRGVPIPDRFFEDIEGSRIPVWYADQQVAVDIQKAGKIKLETYLSENQVITNNIAAFYDLGSQHTIVIGAHYDHLGMGDKNSAYRGTPQIHPGADDNASGVAGVLTLAGYLVNHYGSRQFNFLFLFFGAEEQGLLGSKYWITNPTYPLDNIVAMFNHDMIGRLADDRKLRINGTGTSPEWERILRDHRCYNLNYQLSKGGRGPSDHTSFYNQNIPVLHFFSGLHPEYHKPTDMPNFINYQGIREIVALNATIIHELSQLNNLIEFTPTDDHQESRPVRLNVTMGIIPGYNSDNKGLEVEGVTKGKPADRAGIRKGDYIIRIDDQPIKNIRDYMEALSRYEIGDTAPVQILRAEKILNLEVSFD